LYASGFIIERKVIDALTGKKFSRFDHGIGALMGNLALAPSSKAGISRPFHAWPPFSIAAAATGEIERVK